MLILSGSVCIYECEFDMFRATVQGLRHTRVVMVDRTRFSKPILMLVLMVCALSVSHSQRPAWLWCHHILLPHIFKKKKKIHDQK